MTRRSGKGTRSPTIENAIQQAHDLVASTDTASFKKLWEDLFQSCRTSLRNDLTLEAFPTWILHNVPHEVIPKMLEVVYGIGAKHIEFYAPSLCERFDVPQWQFVLFFGSLSQRKVTTLNAIAKKRRDITFDSLYRELCQIRSEKQPLPDGPFNFKLSEFRSCLKPNGSEDEYESNSEDYQNSDDTSQGTIYASNNEHDFDHDSEVDGDDFKAIFKTPASHNASREPSSSVEGVLDRDIASLIHATSPISARHLGTHIASQLSQGQERPDVELEVPEAGRLPDSEPTEDSITVATNSTTVDKQGQNTSTDETLGQHLIELCNTANSLANTATLLQKEHEELEQGQVVLQSRLTETSEDINAALQSIQLILKSKDNFTPKQIEIEQANWSKLRYLAKKRKIEQTECQEQQGKWLKLKADVKEFEEKIKATR